MDAADRLFDLLLRQNRFYGFLTAGAAVLLGVMVRVVLGDAFSGAPFLTFFPAVLLTALAGGWCPAALAAAVSLLYVWYFLLPPSDSFQVGGGGAIALIGAALVMITEIALIEIIRIAARRARVKQQRADDLLAERNIMFSELQHRVSNNMHLVASMLELQARRLPEGQIAREALRDGAARLIRLSNIHRKLHDAQRSGGSFAPIVSEVLGDLLAGAGCESVALNVQAEPIRLPLDIMTTLVLITTEAATNAIKHVFLQRLGHRLTVSLQSFVDDECELRIADDGPGFPSEPDKRRLGMMILQSLVGRLDGKLRQETANGAILIVTFPLPART